ncbi:MAG: hypothetical protein K6E78_06165 [Treponema sp.]|nr:hypothetical protein [Treponema sp.]
MGLNPIDLQTMYSQLNTVAKQAAHQTQGASLAESMQQTQVVQKNIEEAQKVVQSRENAKSKGIDIKADSNGKGNGGQSANGRKGEEKENEETSSPSPYRLREPYLGQHIDINT